MNGFRNIFIINRVFIGSPLRITHFIQVNAVVQYHGLKLCERLIYEVSHYRIGSKRYLAVALYHHPFPRIDIDTLTFTHVYDLKRAKTFYFYYFLIIQAVVNDLKQRGDETLSIALWQTMLRSNNLSNILN